VAIDAFPLKEMRPTDGAGRRDDVALIDARLLDYYRSLECENIHITLREEAARGWDDIESGTFVVGGQAQGSRGNHFILLSFG
jgi:hypothetical protein